MNPQDILDAAEMLANSGRGKPKQVFLRRAVSSTYYALFHALARCCADSLIGGKSAERSTPAWQQVYRALDHNIAKNQCKYSRILKFPKEIQDFANQFCTLQSKRHNADYDPLSLFTKTAGLFDIDQAKSVIDAFSSASSKDRRAFAAFVLLKFR